MRARHDAQRQHVVDSLDQLVFQLYAISFFLDPAVLPFFCRLATQFILYKPRELDPKLSLRVWFLLLCASNAPSFWLHIKDGASADRAVVLDFVGMAHLPSRLHLVLLDTLILALQILLTTISFEISLRLSSVTDLEYSAIPSSPASLPLDTDVVHHRKYPHHHSSAVIIDLRFRHLIIRLRHPAPLPVDLAPLPLPNTTPAVHLRAILRRREEARRRDESNSAEPANTLVTEHVGTIPGSMSTP